MPVRPAGVSTEFLGEGDISASAGDGRGPLIERRQAAMETGDDDGAGAGAGDSSSVIEIVPVQGYDKQKAKLRLSLAWLLQKAFTDSVPSEFQDPFYETINGSWKIKPHLIQILASGEIYCLACRNLFQDSSITWLDHGSIIQALSRKGIYVIDSDDMAVTESTLMHTGPFKLNAHIALMDALMKGYTRELVSIEVIVQAVRKFTSFTASSELPSNVDDAILFWMNKVSSTAQQRLQKKQEQQQEAEGTVQKGDQVSSSLPSVPVMENIKDIGDGCSLATIISFYYPNYLKFQDICLKKTIGIADALYNLRLIWSVCKQLPTKSFHFTYEDLLYSDDSIRDNILVFLAELFYNVENKKTNFTKGATPEESIYESDLISSGKRPSSVTIPKVPISNATKRSFQRSPTKEEATTTGQDSIKNNADPVSHPPLHHPLLTKRRQQQRASLEPGGDLTAADNRDQTTQKSFPQAYLAWQEPQTGYQSQKTNLLGNVSMDSELISSFSDSSVCSTDIESWTGSLRQGVQPTCSKNSKEPLMPARLKPAKEKLSHHSKEVERDEKVVVVRKIPSPLKPKKIKPPEEGQAYPSTTEETPQPVVLERIEGSASQQDLVPDIDEESIVYFLNQNLVSGEEMTKNQIIPEAHISRKHQKEPVSQSYVLSDRTLSKESARALGLPVVSDSTEITELHRNVSREGSIASNRSSGDFSDHESQKIHRDHKAKETKESVGSFYINDQSRGDDSLHPASLEVKKPLIMASELPNEKDADKVTQTLTTNFAQIKKMRDMCDTFNNSGFVYMQHGREQSVPSKLSLKESFQRKKDTTGKIEKHATFAPAPKQMTWNQNSSRFNLSPQHLRENGSHGQSINPDMIELRMRLEEKRRNIEKKKQEEEKLQHKVRQRVGKEAFLHVVSRHKDEQQQEDRMDKAEVLKGVSQQLPSGVSPYFKLEGVTTDESHCDGTEVGSQVKPVPHSPAFSEDIQKSLENTQKRWLKEAMVKAVRKSPAVREQTIEEEETSLEAADKEPQRRKDHAESYDEYNVSLDKLNQSLTDLHGQIMKLSLKQQQITSLAIDQQQQQREHSQSPPCYRYSEPEARQLTPPKTGQQMSKTVESMAGGDAYHQSPFSAPSHQHIGEMEKSPYLPLTQYQPISQAGQFSPGYVVGQEQYQQAPSYQPHYQQPSPYQPPYPGQGPFILQSPQHSQPYMSPVMSSYHSPVHSVAGLMPQHMVTTYTTMRQPLPPIPAATPYNGLPGQHHKPDIASSAIISSSTQHLSGTKQSISPAVDGYGSYHPLSKSQELVSFEDAAHFHASRTLDSASSIYVPGTYVSKTEPIPSGYSPHPHATKNISPERSPRHLPKSTVQDISMSEIQKPLADGSDAEQSAGKEGFFISFGDETPVRPKPKLKDRSKKEAPIKGITPECASAEIPDFTSAPARTPQPTPPPKSFADRNQPLTTEFLVVEEAALPEDELQKRKENKLILLQLKRKKDQEKKQQQLEDEVLRNREKARLKQEAAERRKAEVKARRDLIFEQYKERKRKEAEEETDSPLVKNVERSSKPSKPRPKSMVVRGRPIEVEDDVGSLHSTSSQEDISKSLASPSSGNMCSPRRSDYKMRKTVSCGLLANQNDLFRGISPRRPASPDFYRSQGRRSAKSTESSSETGSNAGSEFSGPKLFVKPSAKSNRTLIINAISHCCLAGCVNQGQKNKVLEEIAKSDEKHFVILFRDAGCQFKSLYTYSPDREQVSRIHGMGPKQLYNHMIEKFYKYNSGNRSFTEVTSTKHMSVSIDAVTIQGNLWKSSKTSASRR